MRIQIVTCIVHRGKVIEGTAYSSIVPNETFATQRNECIGAAVGWSVDLARKQGWYMQDSETFCRVELREVN